MTLDDLIAACVEARKKFERAEVDYFRFLEGIEESGADIWRTQCASFAEFLQKYVGKPEPRRYLNYKEAVVKLGFHEVESIGIDAAIVAIQIADATKRRAHLEACEAWVDQNGGCKPSAQHARYLRQQVAPVEVVPLPTRLHREMEALRAENAQLRKENKRLKKKLADLTASALVPKGPNGPKGPEIEPPHA